MNRHALMSLAACLLVAADAPMDGMDKLEGRWLGGVWVCNSRWDFVVDLKNPFSALEVTADVVTLRSRTAATARWSYTLDTARTPKAIDLTAVDGPEKGITRRAIYEIRPIDPGGYYLSLCIAEPGVDRPGEFVDRPEAGWRLHSFARYPNSP
jgi:uncharacterized protein (TIGR03067 family)